MTQKWSIFKRRTGNHEIFSRARKSFFRESLYIEVLKHGKDARTKKNRRDAEKKRTSGPLKKNRTFSHHILKNGWVTCCKIHSVRESAKSSCGHVNSEVCFVLPSAHSKPPGHRCGMSAAETLGV